MFNILILSSSRLMIQEEVSKAIWPTNDDDGDDALYFLFFLIFLEWHASDYWLIFHWQTVYVFPLLVFLFREEWWSWFMVMILEAGSSLMKHSGKKRLTGEDEEEDEEECETEERRWQEKKGIKVSSFSLKKHLNLFWITLNRKLTTASGTSLWLSSQMLPVRKLVL